MTLIARHGKIVHVDAYGPADLATGRSVTMTSSGCTYDETHHSVALLMLYEEGKFQLTDPLGRYMPAFGPTSLSASGC